MVQKNNGFNRKHTIIRCPRCKARIDLDEAIENGYVEEMSKIKFCTCEFCEEQFQLK